MVWRETDLIGLEFTRKTTHLATRQPVLIEGVLIRRSVLCFKCRRLSHKLSQDTLKMEEVFDVDSLLQLTHPGGSFLAVSSTISVDSSADQHGQLSASDPEFFCQLASCACQPPSRTLLYAPSPPEFHPSRVLSPLDEIIYGHFALTGPAGGRRAEKATDVSDGEDLHCSNLRASGVIRVGDLDQDYINCCCAARTTPIYKTIMCGFGDSQRTDGMNQGELTYFSGRNSS